MTTTEMKAEAIAEMKRYCGNVKDKGIDKGLYYFKTHHAYALYDMVIKDPLDAFITCFDYGFAKGVQAERNRIKKA